MLPAEKSREPIRSIAGLYLQQVRAMSYDELCARQDPPWASIAFGAGGVAAALLWRSRQRRSARDVEIAERWLSAAMGRSRDRSAFLGSDVSFTSSGARASLHFGVAGLDLVRVLFNVSQDLESGRPGARSSAGKRTVQGPSLRALLARSRRARGGPTEFLLGSAGYLAGLVGLWRATELGSVLRAADALAEDLLSRARGAEDWTRGPALGFAHGRAGTFHALLGWAAVSKRGLPSWFFPAMERLAADIEEKSRMGAPQPGGALLERSWCNGAAGHVLLWTRAYERSRSMEHLEQARRAAELLSTDTEGMSGDLCCGLGGRSYALLAMERVEPARGWEDRALRMALLAT